MIEHNCQCCNVNHHITKEELKQRPLKKGDYCGICKHNIIFEGV